MSINANPNLDIPKFIQAIDAEFDLVRKIADQTIQALMLEKEILVALTRSTLHTIRVVESIQPADSGGALLLDEKAQKKMESAEAKLATLIRNNQKNKDSVAGNPKLRGKDKTAILLGYDQAIACAQLLAQSLEELRWTAMEYDSTTSPISDKTYTDVEKLIADLQS